MSDFKLKITIGNAQIELEGEGELVHTIFQELRKTGLGNISPLVRAERHTALSENTTQNNSGELPNEPADSITPSGPTSGFEVPSLNNVVLQGRPKKESKWMLIYAAYASNWGEILFTREDLRSKYNEAKRATETRSKNFATNLRSLSASNYISAVNDTQFRMECVGLEKLRIFRRVL